MSLIVTTPLRTSYGPPASPGFDLNWNNEPPGFTLDSDLNFSVGVPVGSGDRPYTGGWGIVGGSPDDVQQVSDPTAPKSPSNVFEFQYPQGFEDGFAPANIYFDMGSAQRYYVGFWWKCNPEWEVHPAGDKLCFFYIVPGTMFLLMKDGVLKAQNLFGAQDLPNNGAGTPMTFNTWHKIESLLDKTGTVFKCWVDDQLNMNYTNLVYPTNLGQFEFDPTWGGDQGLSKAGPQTDWFRYDHVRLSHG